MSDFLIDKDRFLEKIAVERRPSTLLSVIPPMYPPTLVTKTDLLSYRFMVRWV